MIRCLCQTIGQIQTFGCGLDELVRGNQSSRNLNIFVIRVGTEIDFTDYVFVPYFFLTYIKQVFQGKLGGQADGLSNL